MSQVHAIALSVLLTTAVASCGGGGGGDGSSSSGLPQQFASYSGNWSLSVQGPFPVQGGSGATGLDGEVLELAYIKSESTAGDSFEILGDAVDIYAGSVPGLTQSDYIAAVGTNGLFLSGVHYLPGSDETVEAFINLAGEVGTISESSFQADLLYDLYSGNQVVALGEGTDVSAFLLESGVVQLSGSRSLARSSQDSPSSFQGYWISASGSGPARLDHDPSTHALRLSVLDLSLLEEENGVTIVLPAVR